MFHIELMLDERTSAIKHILLDCSFLEIYPYTCLHYGHFAWKNLESKLCMYEHGILETYVLLPIFLLNNFRVIFSY